MSFEVKSLSFRRMGFYLFRNLNLNLLPGQLLWVQGANGTGKSSLLKILAGLIFPTKGAIYWKALSIRHSDTTYYNDLFYLGHTEGLRNTLTPVENYYYQCLLSGEVYNAASVESFYQALSTLQIGALKHQTCATLSAGQRRKVALSIAVVLKKTCWILDEPFTSLDEGSIETVKTLLFQHVRQGGIVVVVSHSRIEYAQYNLTLCHGQLNFS